MVFPQSQVVAQKVKESEITEQDSLLLVSNFVIFHFSFVLHMKQPVINI